jgi:hypothetical protein
MIAFAWRFGSRFGSSLSVGEYTISQSNRQLHIKGQLDGVIQSH